MRYPAWQGYLAIAVFGVVLTHRFNSVLLAQLSHSRIDPATLASILAERQKLAGIVIPTQASYQDTVALRRIIAWAFVSGFRWVMIILAALALLSAISAWFEIDGRGSGARSTGNIDPPAPPLGSQHRASMVGGVAIPGWVGPVPRPLNGCRCQVRRCLHQIPGPTAQPFTKAGCPMGAIRVRVNITMWMLFTRSGW